MSHWFHRNPLKATGQQNFAIKMVAQDVDALKICRFVRRRLENREKMST